MDEQIYNENSYMLNITGQFLNKYDDIISKKQIDAVANNQIPTKMAFTLLLKEYLQIDENLFNNYFTKAINELDINDYLSNPYYKNIKVAKHKYKSWEIKMDAYKPYQAFVCNDFIIENNGRLIPQIGYFTQRFNYLAVYENDRLWMSVTPNEIETMKEPIANAKGKVITFGLGLGYFTYMVSLKEEVKEITVIEKDKNVISLFEKLILHQFKEKTKIRIINDDAFNYLDTKFKEEKYDFAFIDIYHDVGDGLPIYQRIKEYEKDNPHTVFDYWIIKSIKAYL